jgi:SAM-dependent methyltransferase
LNILTKLGIAEALYYGPRRRKYLSLDFLLSGNYKRIMYTKADQPFQFEDFIDDAEKSTTNYKYRHSIYLQKQLGSWRWKGMYQFRNLILPIIFKENSKGIDLGGAYGPVSQNAIVDFAKHDIFGRPVKYRDLEDVDLQTDFIYTSHTFEHIPDLEKLVTQIQRVLKPEGYLIVLVPSYSCVSWRVGIHTNYFHNDHVWTFCLSGTPINEPIKNLLAIDTFLEKYFEVTLKKYTGDNSIIILAKNNNLNRVKYNV